jgi:malate dehydrogenase (oxaloacetate-decarboxylating)(NADP+)
MRHRGNRDATNRPEQSRNAIEQPILDDLKEAALLYHEKPRPGKIEIRVTKSTKTQRDLSLAYSPGVAEPVRRISADPIEVYRYSDKGNLVAVVTDGSAVLGLGNVGPLAAKPVMEGKGVLFKTFANIDVFDICVDVVEAKDLIDTVVRIAPGFGGINLEDIAAPKCFEVERALIERLDIPVFHDDQHGTAVIVAAGLINALKIQGKPLNDVDIVCVGAGAAGIASMQLLVELGARRERMCMVDRKGVIHTGRVDLNEYKREVAIETDKRTLEDALRGADIFIGLSAPNLMEPEMLHSMAERPIVFALANPDPEILPELARSVRQDLVIATGRSDYPNQVNNVLGFPYIFRGALDVRARRINYAMLTAAVDALAQMAREPTPQQVLEAYGLESLEFGPEYIIPTPFDPRLIERIPRAVARAAIESGVARVDRMPY